MQEIINKFLNTKNLDKIYLFFSLIFLTQLFNLFNIDLSKFNNLIFIDFINNYQNEFYNIFYYINIFITYCFLLILFKIYFFDFIDRFNLTKLAEIIIKISSEISYTNKISNILENIIYFNMKISIISFVLYRFKILNFYLIDYNNLSNYINYFVENNSINNFFFLASILLIIILQIKYYLEILFS